MTRNTAAAKSTPPIASQKSKRKNKKAPIAGLPSGVWVGKILNTAGQEFFRVRLGKRFTGGKVITTCYQTLEEARTYICGNGKAEQAQTGSVLDLKKVAGESAFVLNADQLREAADAFKRLKDVAGASLTAAIDHYLVHAHPEGGRRTFAELAVEFMKSRASMGVKETTEAGYKSYLRIIGAEWNDVNVGDIKRADIEDWLAESAWAPRTRKNYLVTLTTVLGLAVNRQYVAANVAETIDRPILEDKPPGILTVPQASTLLKVAGLEDPEMVPGITLGLFGGLRRSEICSLTWNEIDMEEGHIEIKGTKAKTRQRRLVTINETLRAWLQLVVKTEGLVSPTRNTDAFGERLKCLVRKREATETSEERPAVIDEWPHNALRHSFASYFYGLSKNDNLTASEMGNSPAVVFNNYRELVKPVAVKAFWDIRPTNAPAEKGKSKSV
jgi:integrase